MGPGLAGGCHTCMYADRWHSRFTFVRSPCSRIGPSFDSTCNTWLADRSCSPHTSTTMSHASPRPIITPTTTQTAISCQAPQRNDHSARNCLDNIDSPAVGPFPRNYLLSRDTNSDLGCPHWKSCSGSSPGNRSGRHLWCGFQTG